MNYDELPKFERFHRRWRKPSTRERRAHAPNCMHKAVYKTAGLAQRVCSRQLATGVPYLRIYQCPDCRFWHLTHKKPL